MRCKACDVLLTDEESVFKSEVTKEYLDLCCNCLDSIPIFQEDVVDWEDEV